MQFLAAAESLKSIGAERSNFPYAKIKHIAMNCQILIKGKLAKEYYFPKTKTG